MLPSARSITLVLKGCRKDSQTIVRQTFENVSNETMAVMQPPTNSKLLMNMKISFLAKNSRRSKNIGPSLSVGNAVKVDNALLVIHLYSFVPMPTSQSNAVGWFEIPVTDMERAMKFYEAVLGTKLERHQVGPLDMAWFPMYPEGKGAAGSLVLQKDWYKPSGFDGVMIYFTATSGDVATELGRVEQAGGKVLQQKKPIGEHGYVAFFLDSDGNRVALHSR